MVRQNSPTTHYCRSVQGQGRGRARARARAATITLPHCDVRASFTIDHCLYQDESQSVICYTLIAADFAIPVLDLRC